LDLDVTNERSIEEAAKAVKERFGEGNLRLLINVAGIVGRFNFIGFGMPGLWTLIVRLVVLQLHPEKSIQKINYDDLLETFKVRLHITAESLWSGSFLVISCYANWTYSGVPTKCRHCNLSCTL